MVDLTFLRARLQQDANGNRTPVTAQTYHQKWGSASRPVLCGCSDGKQYVIKGSHNGRQLITDNMIGRLGQLLGAPVGEIGFANIPQDLKNAQPEMADIGIGIGHATVWVPGCSEKQSIANVALPENRPRFALLLVLYSWTVSNDPQCIYANAAPQLVYSVDHGHFLFAGNVRWTAATIQAIGAAVIDPFFAQVNLTCDEIRAARPALEAITDADIGLVVAGPPDEWGINATERQAFRDLFIRRRTELLALLPH